VEHAASNTDSTVRLRMRFMNRGKTYDGGRAIQCRVRGMARTNSEIGTSNGMPFSPTQ
jgi:hypothetical protein